MYKHALTALSLLACSACEEAEATRVIVHVEADPEVAERATSLAIVATRTGAGKGRPVFDEQRAVTSFPFVIGLSPDGDQLDGEYSLSVSATEGKTLLAVARIASSYVAGQTRHVKLRLEDSCIAIDCGMEQTCHAGTCARSDVDALEFGDTAQSAPRSSDLLDPRGPLARDDGGDGQAAWSDAASRDAARDPTPDAAQLTPDAAQPAPDAAQPTPDAAAPDERVDAGPASVPDAGLTSIVDAGVPDAGMQTMPQPVDAGVQQPVDAGQSFPCAPSGAWTISYVENSGTCGIKPGMPHVKEFHGSLADFLDEDGYCAPKLALTPDGCALNFELECPVKGDSPAYDEVGETRMLSVDHIVTTSNALFYGPPGERPCTSNGTYDMRRN